MKALTAVIGTLSFVALVLFVIQYGLPRPHNLIDSFIIILIAVVSFLAWCDALTN